MARIPHSAAVLLLGVTAAFAAAGTTAPGKKVELGKGSMDFSAASFAVDYKTNTAEYKDIVIKQDDIRVQADRAHAKGLDLENAAWTLEGNVRVQSEQHGNLQADQAIIEFKGNHIAKVTVTGMPAQFEQKRADSDQTAHGHADEIVYDVSDGTVRLSKNAWLSDGRNEISSDLLVYNIREQKVQGSTAPGTDGRVHIVIAPNGKIQTDRKP